MLMRMKYLRVQHFVLIKLRGCFGGIIYPCPEHWRERAAQIDALYHWTTETFRVRQTLDSVSRWGIRGAANDDPAPQAASFRGETKLDRSAKDFRHAIGKLFVYVIAKGR
jgi:hypothetical protein